MKYDPAKLEEMVLALLGAFEFENGRAWKRYDFAIEIGVASGCSGSLATGQSTAVAGDSTCHS